MRTIEIDFEVHQQIEANRRGFEDTPNDVLRRMLGLVKETITCETRSALSSELESSWTDGVVVLPPLTQLKMVYNNKVYLATIRNGLWVDDMGGRHHSPSGAARSLARTKDGRKTNLNGKNYWSVKLPGSSEWVLYSVLERKAART